MTIPKKIGLVRSNEGWKIGHTHTHTHPRTYIGTLKHLVVHYNFKHAIGTLKIGLGFHIHIPLLPLRHASTESIWGRVPVPPACINKVQHVRHTKRTHTNDQPTHAYTTLRGGRLKHSAPHQKSLRGTHTNITLTARSNCVSTNFHRKQHPPLHFSVSFLGKNVSFSRESHERWWAPLFSTVPFFTQSFRAPDCVLFNPVYTYTYPHNADAAI